MNPRNLISEIFTDIESGKFEQASSFFADSFRGVVLGREVSRPIYISAYRALLKGFPDLHINIQNIRTEGSKVSVQLKVTGTNSNAIPGLIYGWHAIPATNKTIDGVIAELEMILKDGKIEDIRSPEQTKGLFGGLMNKLGLDYRKYSVN
ncbi:MAG TPA: ester cyclase [Puia sp.]|nr:ester cyclase [Puia sp.]